MHEFHSNSNSYNIKYYTECSTTSSNPIRVKEFCEKHKNHTNLTGMKLWNNNIKKFVRDEIAFICKFQSRFFRVVANINVV